MTQTESVGVRMVRHGFRDLPEFGLPAGFAIRGYGCGDDQAWTRIHLLADGLNAIKPDLHTRQFGTDSATLGARQFFLCTPDGLPVGTASAWFGDPDMGREWGRVHWVAIIPEYQGRGLANALLGHVCESFAGLDHDRAYLTTATGRVPAVGLYLKFGFIPDIRSDRERDAWLGLRTRGLPIDM